MPSIFICYAHQDNESSDRNERWLDRLQQQLAPLELEGQVEIWSDKKLELGDDWHDKIQATLRQVKAAVLLVSPAFLSSKYIRNSELPVLLKQAKEAGVAILPVILRQCRWKETTFKYPHSQEGPEELSLSAIQVPTTEPLNSLSEHEQDDVLYRVTEAIAKIVKGKPGNDESPASQDIFGASGINAQSQESKILSQACDKLITIVDSIDLNLIKNIIRQSLPNEVINKRPEIINIQNMGNLRQIFLDDYRKRNDGIPRIIDFAHYLYCEPKTEYSLKTELNSWLEEITQKLAISRPACPENQDLKDSEFFLLVVARPESDQFRLVAELHPDPDKRLPSLPIDLQEEERGSECSLKEIPYYLNKFIEKVENEYLLKWLRQSKFGYDLCLELFLPDKYLGKCVEIANQPPEKVGKQCKLVVRSSDRLNSGRSRNNLLKVWKRWKDFNQEFYEADNLVNFVHFPERDYCGNWESLGIELDQKIGLKLISYFPDSIEEQAKLFQQVVESGIPFCVWCRCCQLPEAYLKTEFERIVTEDSIRDFRKLVETVFHQRREAWKEDREEKRKNHLGYHLGILCENPDRMPTDYQATSWQ
jgi:hypothetical protein